MPEYTDQHALRGLKENLPRLECFPSQYQGYEIQISIPEYTSICPRTGLPDNATLTIKYIPDKLCVELKSLKYYIFGYRNLGIFYENIANRVLEDFVAACKPKSCQVAAEFWPRGGITSRVTAVYPRVDLSYVP